VVALWCRSLRDQGLDYRIYPTDASVQTSCRLEECKEWLFRLDNQTKDTQSELYIQLDR